MARAACHLTQQTKVFSTECDNSYIQGCSANKKGVRTHPKNGHFESASNSY